MRTIGLIGHKGNAGRMKHIALRVDFVREQVRLGTIRIEHLHTTKMTADTLTKPLGTSLFAQHAIRLLNTSPPDPDDLEPTNFLYVLSLSQLNVLHSFIYPKLFFHFAPLDHRVVEFVGLCSSYFLTPVSFFSSFSFILRTCGKEGLLLLK